MANNYGFSDEEWKDIMDRDTRCVYCGKEMDKAHTGKTRSDWTTKEHLNEKRPFYKHEGLKKEGLAICCWSCNSSRREKTLLDWFQKPYCTDKDITEKTVANPVKKYIQRSKWKSTLKTHG